MPEIENEDAQAQPRHAKGHQQDGRMDAAGDGTDTGANEGANQGAKKGADDGPNEGSKQGSRKSDLHRVRDLPARHKVLRRARVALIVLALLLCAGTARTLFADMANSRQVDGVEQDTEKTYVQIASPQTPQSDTVISLPGTAYGFVQSPIYARATGYVHAWYTDIGAHVKAGQLLALLDTPELDRELLQATAQQKQAAAALALARTTAQRWRELRDNDAVSQQDYDDRAGQYQQALANTAAAQANMERLQQLEAFKRIVAPFSGIVSQRNIDVGDLVVSGNQGAGGSADRPLFMMSQIDPLRVYVQVPQTYTANIHVGQHIAVTQSDMSSSHFDGIVTHTAGAIDISTRTLQVEVRVPNPEGKLLPGAYVLLHIPTREEGSLLVPGNTLLFRKEGPSVAVVNKDNTIEIRAIHIARDLGKTLEIDQGIAPGDRIVLNPGDAMETGDPVIVKPAKRAGPGGQKNKQASVGQGGKA